MEIQMAKCHYCGDFTGDKKYYYTHTLYKRTGTVVPGASYKYIESKINIPRCVTCHSKHQRKFTYVELPAFILTFTIFMFVFYNLDNKFNFITLLPSTVIGLIISYLIGKIFDVFLTEYIFKVKCEDDIRKNKEVRESLKLGWKLNKSEIK